MTVATSTTTTAASICLQGGWAVAIDDGRHDTTDDKMPMDNRLQDYDATSTTTTAASIYLQGGRQLSTTDDLTDDRAMTATSKATTAASICLQGGWAVAIDDGRRDR